MSATRPRHAKWFRYTTYYNTTIIVKIVFSIYYYLCFQYVLCVFIKALHLSDTHTTTLIEKHAKGIMAEKLIILLHADFFSIGLDEMTLAAVKTVPMYWTARCVFGNFGAFLAWPLTQTTMTNEKNVSASLLSVNEG